ncbi:LysR family transcriptional regulator [Acidisphaera sp. L21]|uniref:LysR family transcriptional regulator n=1 Tax=Acidisphaera sp. L21 TaxID=1641851 RepID=UPI00131CC10D|nr:LysR family transcriptional regulator [Acidisphaera sp. L21]
MDVRDLRYFTACAELGQLRLAADRVGRSQPALSKSIARLEAELGVKLFHREGRGVRLTAVGETLLTHAYRLSNGVAEALGEVAQTARGETGHIRLGSSPTMAEWLLPDLFARLLVAAPELTFAVTIGLGDALRKGLRDGALDLAVAPLTGADKAEFAAWPIVEDILVVAGRIGHPLSGRRITPEALTAAKWMLPAAGLASTAWLRRALVSRNLPEPALQVEVSAKTLLRGVVARTDLLTFLSRRDLHGDGALLVELDCPDLRLSRQFGLLRRPGGYMSPAAGRMAALLLEQVGAPPRHGQAAITSSHRSRKRSDLSA